MNRLLKIVFVTLAVFGISSGNAAIVAPSATQTATNDCKKNERVVSACFWTRGLIYIGSGNPAVRIKSNRPRRILGIKDDENPILPENLSALLTTENPVSGKFLFCSFSARKKGHLQIGCVEKAEQLKAEN